MTLSWWWCWFCNEETEPGHVQCVWHLLWGSRSAFWPLPLIFRPHWQHSAICQGFPCRIKPGLVRTICSASESKMMPFVEKGKKRMIVVKKRWREDTGKRCWTLVLISRRRKGGGGVWGLNLVEEYISPKRTLKITWPVPLRATSEEGEWTNKWRRRITTKRQSFKRFTQRCFLPFASSLSQLHFPFLLPLPLLLLPSSTATIKPGAPPSTKQLTNITSCTFMSDTCMFSYTPHNTYLLSLTYKS